MSTGAIVVIIIAVIVVAALVVVGPALLRQARIRRQFGPEYERLAKEVGSKKAVAELTARQRRVDALDIHRLSPRQQASFGDRWTAVQQQFVENPAAAVAAADTLVWDVMRDRGYPADDRTASLEALSVYHARTLSGYRQAREIRADSASTEQLRDAMLGYRALFLDLVGATTTGPAAAADLPTGDEQVVSPKTADTPR